MYALRGFGTLDFASLCSVHQHTFCNIPDVPI